VGVDAFARSAVELQDADGFDETVEAVVQFALHGRPLAALAKRSRRASIAARACPGEVASRRYGYWSEVLVGALLTSRKV
jgi:hypothetical protein